MGNFSKRNDTGARGPKRVRRGVYDLTAGDMARLLHVDLKTIHNWVNQEHLYARRTEGRHLRFHRVEVVRFLRRFGYPVAPALGQAPPRVLVQRGALTRGLRLRGVEQYTTEGLIATLLEVAAGQYEVFVLELDAHDPALTRELLTALRARPATRVLCVVGLSRRSERRRRFVEEGGDVALASANAGHIVQTARWLTGGVADPPARALTAKVWPRTFP